MIETKVLKVSAAHPDSEIIQQAAKILQSGGLVCFPTETVYGLGADALNPEAVRKVFTAKGRPSDNPLIVHIASETQLFDVADEIPEKGKALAGAYWPGPLTLVMKRTILISDLVTAGLDTVAVRMPNHPVTLELIRTFDAGVVGPSANTSGKPSPTDATHVLEDLRGRVDLVLDAGPTEIGVESTVVDVTIDPPVILRMGGLTRERIEEVVGVVHVQGSGVDVRRSPGTRHRHYSPRAKLIVIPEGDEQVLKEQLMAHRQTGKKVGCIAHSHALSKIETGQFFRVLPSSVELFTRYFFRTLRELDALNLDVIIVESIPEIGLGAAVMDRLKRAAS